MLSVCAFLAMTVNSDGIHRALFSKFAKLELLIDEHAGRERIVAKLWPECECRTRSRPNIAQAMVDKNFAPRPYS